MNFFAKQAQARLQTRRMVLLFALAVAGIVLSVNIVVGFVINYLGQTNDTLYHWYQLPRLFPGVFFWSTLITLALIGFSTLYKVSTLRAGGPVVAGQLGATLVSPDTTNFAYRRLRNVVEEIAIASGVPVPEIFVLEDESAINAFAAGYTPADAAITVTRGCLEKLTRDELQGVIAHEFSHVLNGDMRLNIRLMGVLFGILVIGIIGKKVLENSGRSRSDKNAGPIIAIGFSLMVIGFVGVFFGRLIKASMSRSREYLADASAVQFTRQTGGIAGALKKIGGLAEGSKLDKGGEEVAHMLFGDGVGYSRFFATHPPLIERIKNLEPRFNPQELEEIGRAWGNPVHADDMDAADVSIAGFAPALRKATASPSPVQNPTQTSVLPAHNATIKFTSNNVVQQIGGAKAADFHTAAALNDSIPDRLRVAAYMQEHAMQVVFALLVEAEGTVKEKQLALIEKQHDLAMRQGVEKLLDDIATLHPMQYLPLAGLAFPALRRKSRPVLQQFLVTLNALIHADGQMNLREYCLAKLITVQVMEALDPSRSHTVGRSKLSEHPQEIAALFSLVANYGHTDKSSAQRAYMAGMSEVLPQHPLPYQPPQEWSIALDRALPVLNLLAPAGKELLIQGLAKTIGADGVVTINEAELLRTICATLHCPLPPLLQKP